MTPIDTITEFLGATIQHGPLNNRIYLMNLGSAEPTVLVPALRELAIQKAYTKIFAKVPASSASDFLNAGYRKEAEVAGFFSGREDAVFVCAYFDSQRQLSPVQDEIDNVIRVAKNAEPVEEAPPHDFTIRQAVVEDIPVMARIYRDVFPSYPFPIQEPSYLKETMCSHVEYFAVEHHGEIVALSSAEMDVENRNVEMTDFATREAYRGHRLAAHLLRHMETAMRRKNIASAYTIARAISYPMNLTFSRGGYRYGGLLVNNTSIVGQIESMTVWHKPLHPTRLRNSTA